MTGLKIGLALLAAWALWAYVWLLDEHLKTCPVCSWEKARFQRRCWRCVRG